MSILQSLLSLHNATRGPLSSNYDAVVTRTKMNLPLFAGIAAASVPCFLWFRYYRLRYLLRFSCFVLFTASFLNILQSNEWFCEWAKTKFHGENKLHFVLLMSSAFVVNMLVIRYNWSLPLNIVRNQTNVAAPHWECRIRRKDSQNPNKDIQDDLPPVYPNGWIPVAESSRLPLGSVISVSAIGQKLCVFRGVKGRAYVLDAFCPHLGADMTEEGRVRGECIECPFHGWQFSGEDGQCHKIPYAKKVPCVAKTRAWLTCERNAYIFVWHHAEGEEPNWEIPTIQGVESGAWKYRGRTEHVVNCHIQEIPENGADAAHLHHLHSRSIFQGSSWMDGHFLLDFVEHQWQPDWRPDEDRQHVGRIKLSQRMRFCGVGVPGSELIMDIEQIGPATVHLYLRSWFGRGVLIQHVTSEGPLTQRVVHLLFTESRFRQFPADLLILAEAVMFDRDVAVWNHKRLLRKPILVKEDKFINRYRRWYSQFYSEHSPTLRDIRERTLDW